MSTTRIDDQPAPVPNDGRGIWDLVIADMAARDQLGRQRYGTPLQAHNGRDALVERVSGGARSRGLPAAGD
jgi:hypothetical protein